MALQKITLAEKLRKNEMSIGIWNSIPSAALVNVIGSSGIDFMVIDAEHGPVSMETAEDMVRAAELSGASPLIRVPKNSSEYILRALDIGAHGIHIPHVSTVEDAKRAVAYSKYHPLGERGYTPFTRAGEYGKAAQGYAEKANASTIVVAHIEGSNGIKNIDDIARVKGLDVLFVGPYDLSQSLGKPGRVDDPEVVEGIKRGVAASKKNGIVCGSFACDPNYLDILIGCGVRYITYMVDSSVIAGAFMEISKMFNSKKEK